MALVCAAAAGVSVAAALNEPAPFTLNIVAFMILATLTDLREIKLPWVGDVTLSFVPVLACLIALGLWPAMAVAAVSGITAAWVTRDPVKIAFNVGNYVRLHVPRRPAVPGPDARGRRLHDQGPADVRRRRSSTSSPTPPCSPG